MNLLVIFMCRDVYNVGEHCTILHCYTTIATTEQQISHTPRERKKKVPIVVFYRHEFCSGYFNVGLNEGKSVHYRDRI